MIQKKADIYGKVALIHKSFDYIAKRAKKMPPSTNKKELSKQWVLFTKFLLLMKKIKKDMD